MTTGQFIVHIVGWIAFLGHHVLLTSWEKTPLVSIKYLKSSTIPQTHLTMMVLSKILNQNFNLFLQTLIMCQQSKF